MNYSNFEWLLLLAAILTLAGGVMLLCAFWLRGSGMVQIHQAALSTLPLWMKGGGV